VIPRYAVSTGSTATRDERGGVAFAGYAAVFDVVDRAGDVMRRGAFAGAGVVPLLWQHRGGAVGVLASVAEDARGLRVEGVVEDPELAGLVRSGAVAGLSVGYRAVRVVQGARRVVERPGPVEAPVLGCWRIGEGNSGEVGPWRH